MNKETEKPKIPPLDNARIRDIAEAVYRDRLGDAEVARMIADDKDSGEKLRGRAKIYEPLVVSFCKALGVEVPRISLGTVQADAEASARERSVETACGQSAA